MSANKRDSNDDLTTDAVPSPPRNNNEASDDKDSTDEEIPTFPKNKSHSYKLPKYSKPRLRSPQATASATIINISQSSGIHVGAKNTIIVNKSDKSVKKNKNIVETDDIRSLLLSSASLTRKHLVFISGHLDEGWRDIARKLDYSDGQISQFYESHYHSGMKEVIYRFLLDWTQNDPDDATCGKLARIMWDTNQKDAVSRWSLQKSFW